MKTFMIKNPTYQELEPLMWVRDNVVNKCPYDGPAKHEAEYRRQINLFFWHIVQGSLYPSKRKKFEKFGSIWVPFSRDLGRRECPMVFGSKHSTLRGPVGPRTERTEKHFSRALEWLVANVMDCKAYVKKMPGKVGKSREFRIKRECLDQMYPNRPRSSREILELTRYYSPLKVIQERFGQTIKDMISASANMPFKPRKHDLSHSDDPTCGIKPRKDREARKLYLSVLKKLGPNEIAIDPILEYLTIKSFRGTLKAQKQYHQVMSCLQAILSGPVQIVSEEPLIIRYYPGYTLAKIGGRLFEQGGGFQAMPAMLKQQCSVVGTNWDMESSQLNIIRKEFADNNIPCKFLEENQTVNDMAEKLGLPKKLIKICIYGTLFSVDFLVPSPQSSAVKALRPHFNSMHEVYCFIERWNVECKTFVIALNQLSQIYQKRFRSTQDGSTLRCETGVRYVVGLDQSVDSKSVKKRTMSHCVSGIEANHLFDAILNGGVEIVYSLEHDGALMQTGEQGVVSRKAKFVVKKFAESVDFMSEE